MLTLAELAPPHEGVWKASEGQTVAAANIIDPDNCDPTRRPQSQGSQYTRNPDWANLRAVSWKAGTTTQFTESVITYTSAAAASADFAKHKSWLEACKTNFQWTDAPAQYSISNIALAGTPDAYAIRAVVAPPDQPASTATAQAYAYMAVILRGNSLAVLDLSEVGADPAKPKDPGPVALQHDVQAAAAKLGRAFAAAR